MLPVHAKLAWDDFRLVKAIADHDGLTGAAAALGVNHSTVFRRLGQIEELVGMPLFERRKTGYVATVAGAEMAALASRMDEDVTAFSRRLAGRDVAPSGEIRITTTDTLHLNVLLPIFAAFREAHPLIRLDVVIGNQALNLSKRDADIAIRASDSPGETLVGRRIATIAWAIYGRVQDGLAAAEQADPATLYQHDWVALGDQLAHVKAARFVREHVAPERIALKSSAVLGLAEAVEQGLGIGPLPCFIADQRPGLVRLLPPNPDFATGLWVLTHPDIRHVPRVRAFMDFCSSELARQRALFEGTG
ncbi:LysR family transcriptional regulator [Bosea thiooxidans]